MELAERNKPSIHAPLLMRKFVMWMLENLEMFYLV